MDTAQISVVGILVALVIMMGFAFKGWPLLVIAPLCAGLVCIISGEPILPTLSTAYMSSFAKFAQTYFLLFLFSSIFGRLIGDCGAAKYIAYQVAKIAKKYPGKEKVFAVLAIIAIQSLLTAGGISVFVVVFTMVTIAKNLFEELDVPWSMYTCATLGSGSYTMTMFPGIPAVQNLVPMKYLGTTPTAAPILGLICGLLAMGLGVLWVIYQINRHNARGNGFLPTGAEISKVVLSEEEVPQLSLFWSLVPSVLLLFSLNGLKLAPVWALFIACVSTLVIFWKRFGDLKASLAGGCANAGTSVINVCAMIGFGGTVAAMPGYQLVLGALDKIPGPPIVQLIVAVNVAAGFTGSATGGLTIALENLSQRFLDMGMDPEIIHRMAAMSCGGLDSLPHNPTIINTLTISRLGHRMGYGNYFMMTVAIPLVVTVVGAMLVQIGIK